MTRGHHQGPTSSDSSTWKEPSDTRCTSTAVEWEGINLTTEVCEPVSVATLRPTWIGLEDSGSTTGRPQSMHPSFKSYMTVVSTSWLQTSKRSWPIKKEPEFPGRANSSGMRTNCSISTIGLVLSYWHIFGSRRSNASSVRGGQKALPCGSASNVTFATDGRMNNEQQPTCR